MPIPVGDRVNFLRCESWKYEVWILGLPGQSLGFIQGELEHALSCVSNVPRASAKIASLAFRISARIFRQDLRQSMLNARPPPASTRTSFVWFDFIFSIAFLYM